MAPEKPRRVVLVVIDGMRADAFEQAASSGRAPALQFLRDHAAYHRDSVAIFPTITPAATSTLITGEVPARHGIPGMCWYDREEQRFVNYGQSRHVAMTEGVGQVVEDFLVYLNHHHLSKEVRTLHEQLHELGLSTGATNFMVFRGPFEHRLEPDLLERFLFRRHLPESISGPKEHYFADLVRGPSDAGGKRKRGRGMERHTRLNDKWAAEVTRDLLEQGKTDAILFYLHENDHVSHHKGPESQVDNLVAAGEHIGDVLETFGDWERTLDQVGFVLTADHGQTKIGPDKEHVVEMEDVLADFSRVQPGKGADRFEDHDLVSCGNGRAAFVYLNERRRGDLIEPVARALRESPGIDQVMWRHDGGYVVDSDRGRLEFRRAEEGHGVADERGNRWLLRGDGQAVDAIVEHGEVRTPEYPLAFWRIASALDLDRIGDLVATFRLGYDCADLTDEDHRGGGDHASLHAQDSLVPFLSTLDDPPMHPAAVDVTPHIVRHFRGPA
jgi:predicted AlkP superfamily pyrophosphatase or phosphodiesterase